SRRRHTGFSRDWSSDVCSSDLLTLAALASSGASNRDRLVVEGRGDVWRSSMAMTLAPFLLAAAVSERSIRTVTEWIQNDERDEVLAVLEGGHRHAARAHRTTSARADDVPERFFVAMPEVPSLYAAPLLTAAMARTDLQ